MKKFFLLALMLLGMLPEATRGADDQGNEFQIVPLHTNSVAEYDFKTRTATMTNGGYISYRGVVLTADQLSGNLESFEVEARGSVVIKWEGHLWTGDSIGFNFKTRQMRAANFRTGRDPFYIKGEGLAAFPSTNQNQAVTNVLITTNTFLTTDTISEPAYRIQASRMTIIPGQRVEARNATVYVGDVPVFWVPYLRKSLGRHPNNFVFTPGYDSKFGPYLYTTYNWWWSDQLDGSIHLDLYQKRGVGVGPDFNFDLGQFGRGQMRYYFIKDQDAGLDPNGASIPDDRQHFQFTYDATLQTNLTLKAAVNYQTDPYILRDFFEPEYRRNVQPSSFIELNQSWPNFSLDILTRPKVNTFFDTVEQLPDIKLTGLRQQLGVSPFYYDSDSSIGYYSRQFANQATPDFSAWRADTFQQITLPQTYFGWLNVTPRVGGRFTHYGETDGVGSTETAENRAVFNTGAEVSFKMSRVWAATRNKFFEVEGIRHILEPSVDYVYVPSPSVAPSQLPQFDYEVPTSRLLPIEYPDYNAIDSIDSQNVFRLRLNNKLQTKRKAGIQNVVNWSIYTDWRLSPEAGQTTFADFYSDLTLRPWSWMAIGSEIRYGFDTHRLKESNNRLTIVPGGDWSLTFAHRYLSDAVFGAPGSGNNTFYSSLHYRLNENWGARMTHRFEATDNVMEEQYYTIFRDLRSWTSALTFRINDDSTGKKNYTVALLFSLKAVPRYRLGSDSDDPSYLLSR
ncbi:MAG: LPS-assembly protein LptD [Opitutaceae bacterium]|nr:LPS-assembly protein LptD [Verrucomicrobiales bacterium]